MEKKFMGSSSLRQGCAAGHFFLRNVTYLTLYWYLISTKVSGK